MPRRPLYDPVYKWAVWHQGVHQPAREARFRFNRARANIGTLSTLYSGLRTGYKLGKSAYDFFSSKNTKRTEKGMAPTKSTVSRDKRLAALIAAGKIKKSAPKSRGSSKKLMKTTGTQKKQASQGIRGINSQRTTRKLRKSKKTLRDRMIKNGIQATNEYGEVVQYAQSSGYLGHATCPPTIMRTFIWCAVLKKLMTKAGHSINALNEPINYLNPNDQISVFYRLKPDSATTVTSILISVAGTSILTMAGYFNDPSRPWNGTNYDEISVVWDRIIYAPTPGAGAVINGTVSGYAELKLTHSKIEMLVEQQMKVQNRSIAEAGDDEVTRIDNVPLYMHMYGAQGNCFEYTQKRSGANFNLCAENVSGVIKPTDDVPYAQEPPRPKELNARSYKKIILEPGSIHESKLRYHKTVMFQNVWSFLGSTTSLTSPQYTKKKYGEARLFGFDKMIETIAPGAALRQPIKIAYELNTFYCFQFKPGYNNVTTQLYAFNGTTYSG